MKILFIILTMPLTLMSCAQLNYQKEEPRFPRFHNQDELEIEKEKINLSHLKNLPLYDRLSWPKTTPDLPKESQEKLYSFIAKNMSIKKALKLFSKSYGLNILLDKDIQGEISVEFYQLPFNQAMSALLDSLDFYWQIDRNLIRVRSWKHGNLVLTIFD